MPGEDITSYIKRIRAAEKAASWKSRNTMKWLNI
jgi:hypothetical protein